MRRDEAAPSGSQPGRGVVRGVIRRVIFDTSTLVSAALRPDSVPARALLLALQRCDLCASQETLAELRKVMGRAKFRAWLSDELRQEFVGLIERSSRQFAAGKDFAGRPACRDAKDNKFLALAAAAEADAMVSVDEDLLVLDPWGRMRMLRAGEFLELFGER